MNYQQKIQEIFNAFTNRDWEYISYEIADDFTFTSQYDDHIDQATFKDKCWDRINQIGEFDIVTILEGDGEAIVRYKNTINGERVQNAEHLVFNSEGKLRSVTVFFGRP